jgi:predicted ester cyclase
MPDDPNLELVRQWVAQVWNAGDLDALGRFHPPRFENHGRPSSLLDARQWHLDTRATFPDIRYTVDDLFSAGERVALRWTATATQRGSLWGLVPPTGRRISWSGMHLLRIVDGQIVAVWALSDGVAQLQQLGVTLQPGSEPAPAAELSAAGAGWHEAVWQQFGAAIYTLADTVRACPPELWNDPNDKMPYWYVVYHTLFWLDLYLSGALEGFAPPAPFTLDELDPNEVLPDQPYSQADLLGYLEQCREKCRSILRALTDEQARRPCAFRWGTISYAELLLYNLRHVQDHAAELHLILGQKTGTAPGWVTRAQRREGS